MSREDIVAIASRLFAIFIAVYSLSFVASLFQVLATNQITSGALIGFALVLLVMFAVSAFLWFFPLTVARKLLPVMKEPRSEERIGHSMALSLALTVIGFWLLAKALVDAVYWLMMLAQVRAAEVAGVELDPSQKARIAATAVQLILAIWLIFGSTGINRIVARIKYAGSA